MNMLLSIQSILTSYSFVARTPPGDPDNIWKVPLYVIGFFLGCGLLLHIWPLFIPYLLWFVACLTIFYTVGNPRDQLWETVMNWVFIGGSILITLFYLLALYGWIAGLFKETSQATSDQTTATNESKQHNNSDDFNGQNQAKSVAQSANTHSPWEILGVPESASKEEISKAYKQKMMQNHPDKVASLDPQIQHFATERTKLIKEAYEKLAS